MSASEGIRVRQFDSKKVLLDKEIGSGTFGKVFLATITDSNLPQPVAVKVFKNKISQQAKDNAYEELLKLAVIDHENIVKLHGMVEHELPWLVFEYMKDGNLLQYVIQNDNIKEKTVVGFCRDICSGMAFLHSHQVLHKDLAARNILLHGRTAKIADLGLSSFLTDDEDGIYALNGKLFPYRHAAVECIIEQVYTFESDIWSFGVLLFEIFTGGQTPYGKHNKQPEVRRFIVEGITPLDLLEPMCSSKIYSIIKSVLVQAREDRPNFDVLHAQFQTMLTGKPLLDHTNLHPGSNKDSAAFATFHRIKASGLSTSSSSINNAHQHSPPSTTRDRNLLHPNHFADPQLLSLSQFQSTSTPNIVEAVMASSSSLRAKPKQRDVLRHNNDADRNSLTVREPSPRRSSEQFSVIPLFEHTEQQLSQQQPKDLDEQAGEPMRRRAYSNSRATKDPQLLEGFVQNRFTRKS